MSCSNTTLPDATLECCVSIYNPIHEFVGKEYWRDGDYYGDIIYQDEKVIKVECKKNNKYMKGQVIEMIRVTDV